MTCLNRLLESDGKFLFLLDGLDMKRDTENILHMRSGS